ncbi:MAG: Hsp20/alpha crystallin family protein [Actinomycetota bacterium]
MALLSTLNPWSALSDLQREMNDVMRGVFGRNGLALPGATEPSRTATRTWTPAVDLFTRDGDLVVRAELPGVDAEKDVDIQVADSVLTIRGQRRAEHRDEGTNYVRMETTYGSFERSIPLPEGINPDDIRATHRQGILEVVVPGAAQVAPARKIPVQIEAAPG